MRLDGLSKTLEEAYFLFSSPIFVSNAVAIRAASTEGGVGRGFSDNRTGNRSIASKVETISLRSQ